jgi:hypothetical protein
MEIDQLPRSNRTFSDVVRAGAQIIGALLLSAAAIGLYVLFEGSVRDYAPDNAEVFYHRSSNTFATPPCVFHRATKAPFARYTTDQAGRLLSVDLNADVEHANLSEMKGVRLDETCRETNPLNGEAVPLWKSLVFGTHGRKRWDKDGRWEW